MTNEPAAAANDQAGARVPRSILVGTDGSPTATIAVRRAAAIAAALNARLDIVCAVRQDAKGEGLWPGAIAVDPKWQAALSAAAEEVVSAAKDSAKAAGVADPSGQVVSGNPPEVLVDTARERSVDLIVVGSRGIRSASRRALGNVPNKLVHTAPCDVLVVDTDT